MNSVRLPGPSPFYPRSWKFAGRLPHDPPPKADDRWKPDSKLHLREAVNLIGEHEVPGWDNTERKARSGFTAPKPPWDYYYSNEEADKYPTFDKSGRLKVVDKAAAKAWWKSIEDSVWAEWRAEIAARERWDSAINITRNFLAEQRITGELLTEWGLLTPVPAYQWLSKNAGGFFSSGYAKYSDYVGQKFLAVEGVIVIDRKAVDSLWDEKTEAARPVEAATFDDAAFPYVAFLVRAAREMPFPPTGRTAKKAIEGWLRDNWPESLGRPTDSKIGYMATFLRRPEDEAGGIHGSSGT